MMDDSKLFLKYTYMKFLILLITLLVMTENLHAQSSDYFNKLNNEAKALIEKKSYVGALTKIGQMEKEISKIKLANPSANTSALENEIKQLKESLTNSKGKTQDERSASKNATTNNIKLKKMLDGVFNIGAFTFSNLETAQAENDAYKAEVDELLAMQPALNEYIANMKKSNDYEQFVGRMKGSFSRTFDTFKERVERIMAQSTGGEANNWKNVYYEMQAEQIHWNAAQQTFPDEPAFAEAYKSVTALANKYGGLDKIAGQNKINNAEKIKSQVLPTAMVKDAALEKIFVDAFNKRYATEYKGIATKAIMLQSDWQTERNKLTGVVTGRIRQGAIVYKTSEGKCFLVSIVHVYQDYIGNSFQNPKAVYAQDGQEMLCENVK